MPKFQTIRFMQTTNQSSGNEPLPRGVRRRYEIVRDESSKGNIEPCLICDTEKSLLRGITRFHHNGLNVGFLSASNRQGTAWELEDVDSKRMGEVTARDMLKSSWQARTPQRRIFEIYDQANIGEDILRSTLGSWPDAYTCIEGLQEVGVIRREERGQRSCKAGGHDRGRGYDRGRSGRPSFLGRLKKMMVTHDWVFSHTENITPEEELLLISSMLAIIEVTVPSHCSD